MVLNTIERLAVKLSDETLWELIQVPTNILGGLAGAVFAPLNFSEIVILGGHDNVSGERG